MYGKIDNKFKKKNPPFPMTCMQEYNYLLPWRSNRQSWCPTDFELRQSWCPTNFKCTPTPTDSNCMFFQVQDSIRSLSLALTPTEIAVGQTNQSRYTCSSLLLTTTPSTRISIIENSEAIIFYPIQVTPLTLKRFTEPPLFSVSCCFSLSLVQNCVDFICL